MDDLVIIAPGMHGNLNGTASRSIALLDPIMISFEGDAEGSIIIDGYNDSSIDIESTKVVKSDFSDKADTSLKTIYSEHLDGIDAISLIKTPDYDKAISINLMTTWISNDDGYILVNLNGYDDSSTLTINDTVYTESGESSYNRLVMIPIEKGSSVKKKALSYDNDYFIPIKIVYDDVIPYKTKEVNKNELQDITLPKTKMKHIAIAVSPEETNAKQFTSYLDGIADKTRYMANEIRLTCDTNAYIDKTVRLISNDKITIPTTLYESDQSDSSLESKISAYSDTTNYLLHDDKAISLSNMSMVPDYTGSVKLTNSNTWYAFEKNGWIWSSMKDTLIINDIEYKNDDNSNHQVFIPIAKGTKVKIKSNIGTTYYIPVKTNL